MARTIPAASVSFACGVFLLATLPTRDVLSAEFAYGLDTTLGYSDNIAKVDGSRSGGTVANLGVILALQEKTSRLETDIAVRGKYERFSDSGYSPGFVGQLEGEAIFQLARDHLSWTIEDSYGQAPRNQLLPDTADNRQNLNFFNTGPNLRFDLGSQLEVRAEGRYSDLHFMGQDVGNRSLGGSLRLRRELSASTGVALEGTADRVKFDAALAQEPVDRKEYFLRYEANGARTVLWIDLGGRGVKQGADSSSGLLVRADLTRRISTNSQIRFQVGRENKDAGALFTQLQGRENAFIQDIDPIQRVADTFQSDYATMRWRATGIRTAIELSAEYYGEKYRNRSEFDRNLYEATVDVSRELNRRVSIGVSATYRVQDFTQQGRKLEDADFDATVEWQVGTRTFVTLNGRRLNRAGDVGTAGYSENQVWVQLSLQGGSEQAGTSLQTRGTSPFDP